MIVAGAGLAGLSAAYELRQKGCDVEILEAQSRPGGRVQTLREPFADGMYAEAGPMSFPDSHQNVMNYVEMFDLPLFITEGRHLATTYHVRGQNLVIEPGKPVAFPLPLTSAEQQMGLAGMSQKYLLSGVADLGDPTQPGWPPESLRACDAMTGAQYMKTRGASDAAVKLLSLGYLDATGDGTGSYSALYMLLCFWAVTGARHVYTLRGGNDQLPRAFASALEDRIRYGAQVLRIESQEQGVRVAYRHAGRIESSEADHLIAALPFSVLQDVEVEPAFSPDKQRAIAELPNTSVTRVYLQSQKRFWEREDLSGSAYTDLPIGSLFSAYQRTGARGILETFTAGPQSRAMTAMSEAARFDFSFEQARQVYPEIAGFAEGGAEKCWDLDPWARGGYAWYKPGQFFDLYPHLATPEGRVHFAGDQTSLLPGWMEGALQSGLRAAQEIISAGGSSTPNQGDET